LWESPDLPQQIVPYIHVKVLSAKELCLFLFFFIPLQRSFGSYQDFAQDFLRALPPACIGDRLCVQFVWSFYSPVLLLGPPGLASETAFSFRLPDVSHDGPVGRRADFQIGMLFPHALACVSLPLFPLFLPPSPSVIVFFFPGIREQCDAVSSLCLLQ